ncbi:hypothetical protein Moror_17916 [Moniliophthora roreri MCA 2997]|uniref:Uncharacterized protein n=1 Tax=Moniliophthora roreri (strain MCA 2997) TaxID=1381753 RepID=V2XWH5_MONRO|nr:hypothetical protein Moror_17916 [Moniliophthora roreri MCA 2997]
MVTVKTDPLTRSISDGRDIHAPLSHQPALKWCRSSYAMGHTSAMLRDSDGRKELKGTFATQHYGMKSPTWTLMWRRALDPSTTHPGTGGIDGCLLGNMAETQRDG